MMRSRLDVFMSSRVPKRLGIALKNQMWTTGEASSMWPMRLQRTGVGDFPAAAVADHPLVLHAAVPTAGAFPVLLGAEDSLAEEAVLFGAVGPVVDRFRLLDLAERPARMSYGLAEPDLDGARNH